MEIIFFFIVYQFFFQTFLIFELIKTDKKYDNIYFYYIYYIYVYFYFFLKKYLEGGRKKFISFYQFKKPKKFIKKSDN